MLWRLPPGLQNGCMGKGYAAQLLLSVLVAAAVIKLWFGLPLLCLQELIPELSAAVEKVGMKWSDFTVTDNTCKPHPPQKSLVQVSSTVEVLSHNTFKHCWQQKSSKGSPFWGSWRTATPATVQTHTLGDHLANLIPCMHEKDQAPCPHGALLTRSIYSCSASVLHVCCNRRLRVVLMPLSGTWRRKRECLRRTWRRGSSRSDEDSQVCLYRDQLCGRAGCCILGGEVQ